MTKQSARTQYIKIRVTDEESQLIQTGTKNADKPVSQYLRDLSMGTSPIDEQGQVQLTDSGQRVDVHQPTPDTMEQGLLLAAQKFGGEVYITGDAYFREQATRQAVRMGIAVADKYLHEVVQYERGYMQQERKKQSRGR